MDTVVRACMRILKLLEPLEPSGNDFKDLARCLPSQLSIFRMKNYLNGTPVARHGPIMGHNEAYGLQEAF